MTIFGDLFNSNDFKSLRSLDAYLNRYILFGNTKNLESLKKELLEKWEFLICGKKF